MNVDGETKYINGDRDFTCRWGENCPTHTTAIPTNGELDADLIEIDGSLYFHQDHRLFALFDETKGISYPTQNDEKYDCGWGGCTHTATTQGGLPADWHVVHWPELSVNQLYIDPAHFDLIELDVTDTPVTYTLHQDTGQLFADTPVVKRYLDFLA